MARNRTGNYPISGKACDVEYRAKRLEVLTEKCRLALASIDPAAVHEGSIARGLELVTELAEVTRQILGSKPAKRSYKADKAEGAEGAEKPKKEKKEKAPKEPKAPKAPKKGKGKGAEVTSLDEALEATDAELNDDLDVAAE